MFLSNNVFYLPKESTNMSQIITSIFAFSNMWYMWVEMPLPNRSVDGWWKEERNYGANFGGANIASVLFKLLFASLLLLLLLLLLSNLLIPPCSTSSETQPPHSLLWLLQLCKPRSLQDHIHFWYWEIIHSFSSLIWIHILIIGWPFRKVRNPLYQFFKKKNCKYWLLWIILPWYVVRSSHTIVCRSCAE